MRLEPVMLLQNHGQLGESVRVCSRGSIINDVFASIT